MMCIVIYDSAFLGYFNTLYTYFDSEIPSALILEHPFFKIFLKGMLPDTHRISMLHMLIACTLHNSSYNHSLQIGLVYTYTLHSYLNFL